MDIFGEKWERHFERISEDWLERVTPDDTVLLPGDLTWAMRLEDAKADIDKVASLPGRKIITRGNHDYWWSAIARVRDMLPKNFYALQNDALTLDGVTFAGTRGWLLPLESADPSDEKIFKRELGRLTMSLDRAVALSKGGEIVCMVHYPPLTDAARDTEVTSLIEKYPVKNVVYGHLHGPALKGAFRGEHNGISYHQVSCDGTDFKLVKIL